MLRLLSKTLARRFFSLIIATITVPSSNVQFSLLQHHFGDAPFLYTKTPNNAAKDMSQGVPLEPEPHYDIPKPCTCLKTEYLRKGNHWSSCISNHPSCMPSIRLLPASFTTSVLIPDIFPSCLSFAPLAIYPCISLQLG